MALRKLHLCDNCRPQLPIQKFKAAPQAQHGVASKNMQDHVQLRFKAKEAMAIASTRESAGKFEEASAAYTLAADICAKAKTLAIAAGADAKAMRDAEVQDRFAA